jgi:hypothetical protein
VFPDVEQVEAKVTVRTKAIMPVHTYGHPVDMDALNAIAQKHGLFVLNERRVGLYVQLHPSCSQPAQELGEVLEQQAFSSRDLDEGEAQGQRFLGAGMAP